MRFAIFLGCTAPVRTPNYEKATRAVCEELGFQLIDLPFTCCGFPIEALRTDTALTMAARNLAEAERSEATILTMCGACAGMLTKTNNLLRNDEETRGKVTSNLKMLGYEYSCSVKVNHFARFLFEEVGIEKIRRRITRPLGEVKIAPYYGCHYLRPSDTYDRFDDPEDPRTLDLLIEATGATSLKYQGRTKCCGGAILAIDEDLAFSIANGRLLEICSLKPDAMVLICPYCGIMYDILQSDIESKFNSKYGIPVLYYPQLLGLAMDIPPQKLGIELNRTDAAALLRKIGI